MIRRASVLLLPLLAAAPATAVAQDALRIAGPSATVDAGLAWHRGHPAHPLDALRALGAEILDRDDDDDDGGGGGRTVVRLFGDTLEFAASAPFFLVAERVHQLADPVYTVGDTLFLPRQFFVEWLPTRHPDRVDFDAGILRTPDANVAAAASPSDSGAVDVDAIEGAAAAGDVADTADVDATPVVILDPGHGGRDPGRPGPDAFQEKDFTLALGHELADLLRGRGYEVHLTRTTDTLVAVTDRPGMANKLKAGRPRALFISLHANAFRNRSVRGFETYFLSEARTEDEARVAEMENASIYYERNGDPMAADTLDHILNSLRNSYYVRASRDLAASIQAALDPVHPSPNRGVKQGPFYVLVGSFMPAVLVEVAYLTNPRDAALLRDAGFQTRIAGALADAVDEFFDSHVYLSTREPPP
ncbi:MAG: N-acetylmuramoyl-L-alanine amidase family protein [Gemmatimonadota bacterium]